MPRTKWFGCYCTLDRVSWAFSWPCTESLAPPSHWPALRLHLLVLGSRKPVLWCSPFSCTQPTSSFTAHEGSCQLHNVEVRVWSQASPCWNAVDRAAVKQVPLQVSLFSRQYHSTTVPHSKFIYLPSVLRNLSNLEAYSESKWFRCKKKWASLTFINLCKKWR